MGIESSNVAPPLEKAREAHALLESHLKGKLVLIP